MFLIGIQFSSKAFLSLAKLPPTLPTPISALHHIKHCFGSCLPQKTQPKLQIVLKSSCPSVVLSIITLNLLPLYFVTTSLMNSKVCLKMLVAFCFSNRILFPDGSFGRRDLRTPTIGSANDKGRAFSPIRAHILSSTMLNDEIFHQVLIAF